MRHGARLPARGLASFFLDAGKATRLNHVRANRALKTVTHLIHSIII
jgi:hypothetical protein